MPGTVAGLAALSLTLLGLGRWWADDDLILNRPLPVAVAVFMALLAAVLPAAGLAGADELLERSTARCRPLWRAVHLGVVTLVTMIMCGAAGTASGVFDSRTHLIRNIGGLLGLTVASVVLLGASVAWAPPVAYMLFTYLVPTPVPPGSGVVWAWAYQPASTTAATATAAVLYVVAAAGYIVRGARPG